MTFLETQWIPSFPISEGTQRATRLFQDHFGTDPTGVWSAPGRVNIIGEHTDYNGGFCLPIALPHRAFVAAAARTDSAARFVSAQSSSETVIEVDLNTVQPGSPSGWTAYTTGVLWALHTQGFPPGAAAAGIDAAVDSAVPFAAGLSSSASLESAIALATDALHNFGLADSDAGRAALATACIKAENDFAGAPTGGMDQSISLRAREGHALLLDCQDNSVRHVPFNLADHDVSLLVIDTRAPHALVDGQYRERRDSCERAAALLGVSTLREISASDLDAALKQLHAAPDADVLRRRVRHVVTEIARVIETVALLDVGDFRHIGPVLNASHESLRLDYEVSCPELDLAVTTAREHGALGARMTGGGFGGSAIALVPAGTEQEVASAILDAFRTSGFTDPAFLLATASGPAQ